MTENYAWASRFATLSSIEPDDPRTWQDRIFLTIDLDWAADEVVLDTIQMLEAAGVAATFFVTHATPLLARLRRNPKFELGIHPDFNGLLDGTASQPRSAVSVIDNLLALVPEAKAVRSHSMTQSSRLLDLFRNAGLTHESNHFIPAHTGIALKPFRHWNGLVRAPYFWEDDVALAYKVGPEIEELALEAQRLKVFDFHPIHIALNTADMEHYERTRSVHGDWAAIQDRMFEGTGIRTLFQRLLKLDSVHRRDRRVRP